MRVLVVTNQYAPVMGGIEVLLPQLLPRLRDLGHEIEIVSSLHARVREPEGVTDGFPIHRTGLVAAVANRDPAGLLRERKRLGRIVARFEPDLVHAHDFGPNMWAIARNGPRQPLVITAHLDVSSVMLSQRGPIAATLRESDWTTGVSQAAVDSMIELEPSIAGRVSVITNGIPTPREPAPYRPAAKRVVCLGRLVAQKGFDVAVRAFARVLADHPTARLVFAGEGSERGALEALAESLGVSDRVDFLGVVPHDDIPDLLAGAAVVAVPSRYEGMPLVVLEAGAAARPVVCTPAPGILDTIVPDATATVVDHDDPVAFAGAVSALLSDPARAEAYGRAGLRLVGERHSLQRCAADYDALYRSLVPALSTTGPR